MRPDLHLDRVVVADAKYVGIQMLRMNGMTGPTSGMNITDSLIVGSTHARECLRCQSLADSGCHQHLSRQSVADAGTSSYGIVSTTYSMLFAPGPETKTWTGIKGYATLLGFTYISGTTFMRFGAEDACERGVWAFSNHRKSFRTTRSSLLS